MRISAGVVMGAGGQNCCHILQFNRWVTYCPNQYPPWVLAVCTNNEDLTECIRFVDICLLAQTFSLESLKENNFYDYMRIVSISTIIRRFISYVGKVNPSDFKNTAHATLVDQ